MNDSDFIYNWRNDLKSHSSGMDFLVKSEAENLKLQGYNKSDIIESLKQITNRFMGENGRNRKI